MYEILLVEDDSALRYLYSKMKTWTEYGFTIKAEAANGRDALKILEAQRFDLVMTDIRMPFVDGLTLLKEIKDRSIDVFSILISTYNEFEYARQGLILGAFDYIVKPVNEMNLSETLQRAKIYLGERDSPENLDAIVRAAAEKTGVDAADNPFLHRVCRYLSENMGRWINMEDAAGFMKLSKDYFGKTFKNQTGITFNYFYSVVKIEYAKLLLETGDYKNYEISDILGYSNPDYFTKIFKEITGTTPANYKKSPHV